MTSRSTRPATSTSTGHTYSADFTTTPGAFDRTWAGDTTIFWGDAFVAKVDVSATAPPHAAPAASARRAGAAQPGRRGAVAPPVTFDWGDVTGAASYTIQVDEISAVRRAADPERQHDRLAAHDQRAADGTWFWRVRAVNSAGSPGAWSAVRTITVQSTAPPPPPPVPGTPALASPAERRAGLAAVHVRLERRRRTPAWYVIEADDSSAFSAPLVWAATTTPSQLATNSLPERHRCSGACGRSTPTASPARTPRCAPCRCGSTAPPPGTAVGAVAAQPGRRRPLRARQVDHVRLERRRGGGELHDPDRRLELVLGAAHRRRDARVLAATRRARCPTTRMWWRVRANDGSGAPGPWSSARRFEVKD